MAVLKTVSQLKDSVSGLLAGIDLNNVSDLNGALERACRVLIQKADVPEANGLQNITLYSGVTNYPCNDDIFGTAVRDIRPQGISRQSWDFVNKEFPDDFDRNKGFLPSGTMFSFAYTLGVPTIQIVSPFPTSKVVIDPMSQIGNWVASGTASNLQVDVTNFYQTPSSLRFTMTSGVGTLTETLQSPLSMSDYEGVGVAFLAIQIPEGSTASNLTSIQLKIGSDNSNYSSISQTEGFLGAWISGEWLLVAFDFASATNTGTPDWSAIDYVQINFTTSGTFTNFRVGYLFMSLPSANQILYPSAAIFKPQGSNTALTTITANTDTIILNNPAYTLYEYECALSVLQQTGGAMGDSMTERIRTILNGSGKEIGLYDHYRGDNPSQQLRTSGTYYQVGGWGSGNNGWWGTN